MVAKSSNSYASNGFDIGLGIDGLINPFKIGKITFGAFAGPMLGMGILSSNQKYLYDENGQKYPNIASPQIDILSRIGLFMQIKQHHKIDLLATLPLYNFNTQSFSQPFGEFYTQKLIKFSIGYKYIF